MLTDDLPLSVEQDLKGSHDLKQSQGKVSIVTETSKRKHEHWSLNVPLNLLE